MSDFKTNDLIIAELEKEMASGNELEDLLRISAYAAAFWPPLYPHSILGWPLSWVPPYPKYSEFNIMDHRQLKRAITFLIDVVIPAIPSEGPRGLPPFIQNLHWRPTTIYRQPDQNGNDSTFPEETWFFINGVATNKSVAEFNSGYIAQLFHRPVTVVQNSTDSIWVDLVECIIGKGWNRCTEPAVKALPLIADALKNQSKKKVVVVCHSEGTIIMSNILRALKSKEFKEKLFELHRRHFPDTAVVEPEEFLLGGEKENFRKLEIYAFANCATDMSYYDKEIPSPIIENYGNEYDLVARLGMLAPQKDKEKIYIDGPNYRYTGKWGHFLNEHYLFEMNKYLSNPEGQSNPYVPFGNDIEVANLPRLYCYYKGGQQLSH